MGASRSASLSYRIGLVGFVPLSLEPARASGVDRLALRSLEEILRSGQVSEEDLAVIKLEMSDGEFSYQRRFERILRLENAITTEMFSSFGDHPPGSSANSYSHRAYPGLAVLQPVTRALSLCVDLSDYHWMMQRFQAIAVEPYHRTRKTWDEPGSQKERKPRRVYLPGYLALHVRPRNDRRDSRKRSAA